MAKKVVVLLPAGTKLLAGEPPPPTKSGKAIQGAYWAGLPILMAVIVNVFQGLGTFYPDAPDWVLRSAGYALMVLAPVLAYYGVHRATDLLRQPVQTIEGVSLEGQPIVAEGPPGRHAAPDSPIEPVDFE